MEIEFMKEIARKSVNIVVTVSLCFGAAACSSINDHKQSPDGYDANMDQER